MREYSQKIYVDYSMVDEKYMLRLSSLMRFMQNAATEHYEKKGLGRARLISEGMVFLLSKIAIKLSRHIMADETLTIKTWEEGVKGAYFVRDFEFCVSDEVVGQAQTLWVIVNPETHAIIKPSDFPYPIDGLDRGVDVSAGKVGERGMCEAFSEIRRVRYSDLDCNGHMNNCIYADYCIDLLSDYYAGKKSLSLDNILFYASPERGGEPAKMVEGLSKSEQGELKEIPQPPAVGDYTCDVPQEIALQPLNFEINFTHEAFLGEELTLAVYTQPAEESPDDNGRFVNRPYNSPQESPIVITGTFPDGKTSFKARFL